MVNKTNPLSGFLYWDREWLCEMLERLGGMFGMWIVRILGQMIFLNWNL
jgi:hypothetical protein